MLKREIKYEDFNGNPQTETFYFNFSKREVIEFQVERDDLFDLDIDTETAGITEVVKAIGKAEESKRLIKLVQYFILHSYGIKSDDGKKFIKNDELREDFANSAAYNTLWEEIASDDKAAAAFVQGVFPKDMSADIQKLTAEVTEAKALQEVPQPPRPPN